ncbi:hypothetical protein [Brucella anthropi]|uniref:hypothetical protein n=1 Tax=Brucella anthropi TaxID=529 RepID=UPI0015FAE3CD|nr:hypothetical protein [Brucella anthropi]
MSELNEAITSMAQRRITRPTKFQIYRTLFSGRYFSGMLAFGLIQQLIVASSVIFLADAAASLSSGANEHAVRSFLLFLVTMVLPYIPGVASQYCWQVWKAVLVKDFHRFAIGHIEGGPKSYASSETADKVTSVFSNGVPNALEQVADYAYDFSQCVFNSLCGSLAIAAFIDPRLGIAYFFTLGFCALYIHRYYSISSAAAEVAETERMELSTISRRIWPNLVLRNGLSLQTWTDRLLHQHSRTVNAVQKEARIRNISSLVLSLASVVPIVLICTALIYTNMNDREYLASLFVSMPRMFSILALVSMLLFMVFDFSSVYGQLRVVEELFSDKEHVGAFDLNRIRIEGDGKIAPISSLDALLELCQHRSHIKIRGENGAGKTSLLLAAKERLGDRAFYLPAMSLLDLPTKLGSGSTGQIKRNEIEAVLRDFGSGILLLDEWDANLDAENRRQTANLISEALTKGFTVVEISHR